MFCLPIYPPIIHPSIHAGQPFARDRAVKSPPVGSQPCSTTSPLPPRQLLTAVCVLSIRQAKKIVLWQALGFLQSSPCPHNSRGWGSFHIWALPGAINQTFLRLSQQQELISSKVTSVTLWLHFFQYRCILSTTSRIYLGHDALVAVNVVSVLTSVGHGLVIQQDIQPHCSGLLPFTSHLTTVCQPHRKHSDICLALAKEPLLTLTELSSAWSAPGGVQLDGSFTCLESFVELAVTFPPLLPQACPWFTAPHTQPPRFCCTSLSTTINSSFCFNRQEKNSCVPVKMNVSLPKDYSVSRLFTTSVAKNSKANPLLFNCPSSQDIATLLQEASTLEKASF